MGSAVSVILMRCISATTNNMAIPFFDTVHQISNYNFSAFD